MTTHSSKALEFPFPKDEYTSFLLSGYMKNPYIECKTHQHHEECESFPADILCLTEKYIETLAPHRGSYQWIVSLTDIKNKNKNKNNKNNGNNNNGNNKNGNNNSKNVSDSEIESDSSSSDTDSSDDDNTWNGNDNNNKNSSAYSSSDSYSSLKSDSQSTDDTVGISYKDRGIVSDAFEIGGIVWRLAAQLSWFGDTVVEIKLRPCVAKYTNVEACAKLCFVHDHQNQFFVYPFDLTGDGDPVHHSIYLDEINDTNDLTILIHIQILRMQNSDSLIFDYNNWPSNPQTFKWNMDQSVIKQIVSCHTKPTDTFYIRQIVSGPIFNNFYYVYVNCQSLSIHVKTCGFPKERILVRSHTERGTLLKSERVNTRISGEIYIQELNVRYSFDVKSEDLFEICPLGEIDELNQLKTLTIQFCDVSIETVDERNFVASEETNIYEQYSENMKAIDSVKRIKKKI